MELSDAQLVVNLCQTFHCTPSQLEQENAEVIRLMEIIRLGTKEEEFDG